MKSQRPKDGPIFFPHYRFLQSSTFLVTCCDVWNFKSHSASSGCVWTVITYVQRSVYSRIAIIPRRFTFGEGQFNCRLLKWYTIIQKPALRVTGTWTGTGKQSTLPGTQRKKLNLRHVKVRKAKKWDKALHTGDVKLMLIRKLHFKVNWQPSCLYVQLFWKFGVLIISLAQIGSLFRFTLAKRTVA